MTVDPGQAPPSSDEKTEAMSNGPPESGSMEAPSKPAQPTEESANSTALEQFKLRTRYPATTRKINENSHDLLSPGARYEQRHKLPGDRNNPNLEWEVLFTADRFYVRDKEPLLITLQLWNKGNKVRPNQVTMLAEAVASSKDMKPVSLVASLDGTARTVVFTPNNYWPDYVGQIRVTAEFSAEGLEKQNGSLDFFFTGASRIPAIFTGKINDRLDGGDLLFDIELDVKFAGNYRIDGGLQDSSGIPFGWARFEGQLPSGLNLISLRYYGLLFHDTQAVGPYILTNLHGSRLRPVDTPHKEDMPELASDYVTKAFYELNRFRTDVNNSPRRQRMIEMYEDAERRGVKLVDPAYTGDG